MYSQRDIEDAVEDGMLTADQAAGLRSHVAARRSMPTVDEEYFRFITGFNDIFVTAACVLMLVGAAWLGNQLHLGGLLPSPFAALLVAMAALGLSEIFVLNRRMALPGIVLAFAFAFAIFFTTLLFLFPLGGQGNFTSFTPAGGLMVIAAVMGAGAAFVHWRRFQVPIAMSLAAGMAVLAAIAVIAMLFTPTPQELMAIANEGDLADVQARMDRFQTVLQVALLVIGVAVFAWAMWWDGSDLRRETERSEVAFWLHWLAAAMIVHPLVSMLGLSEPSFGGGAAIALVLLYAFFVLVALVTSRRAILIAALAYLLYAVKMLLGGGPMGSQMPAVLAVALVMVPLAIFWSSLRAGLLAMLPAGLQARLPAAERSTIDDGVY
ncbi:hypothetical protein [Allosphingosinicella sp.]|jgi:hypothetical protein|uniref:hypothetical protein n=1 Tax=Allosphingosinicella sp. TaxID=2823234 RepID=UPI002F1BB5F7